MNRIAMAATMVMLSSAAYAQIKGGDYICIAEWAAGGRYDGGKWDSAKFLATEKFRLIVRFIRTSEAPPRRDYYNVFISDVGSVISFPCLQNKDGYPKNFDVGDPKTFDVAAASDNSVACWVPNTDHDYRFSINTLRFLKVNSNGFIDGKDANDSTTPYVKGGTCTKIGEAG